VLTSLSPKKGANVRKFVSCVFAAALVIAGPANAAWYKASSKHFVIFAEDRPKPLHDFAERLERFDAAVRIVTHMDDPQIGKGNRLTIFVMPKAADVRALVGDKTGFLDGFYTGRVSGPLAYIGQDAGAYGLLGETIFFHEYTHHLMMQDVDAPPYPEWFVEGYAEFFSTPRFDRDGSVELGLAAQHRAWGLFNGPKEPVTALFAGMQPNMPAEQREVFYGRAWLLTHYLLMSGKRTGQLTNYVNLLASGVPSLDAARQAFGDLGQLDRELNSYLQQRLYELKLSGSKIHIGAIEVTPLSGGAAAVIIDRAKIKYREHQPAEELAAQVRAIEARFPGDDLVERTLSEAELNAEHPQAAEAAADRALRLDPQNTEAMVLKGRALISEGRAASDRAAADALFDRARQVLIAANKIDTEDPEPLYQFYRTFVADGRRPTQNALEALHYASDLAPQDFGVRMNSAIAYLNEGKFKEARATLTVVAYSPHAGPAGDTAKRMIADIDAGKGKAALLDMRQEPREQSGSH
jgi:tetratricopeptide (TPR) repeat protein